MAEGKPLQFCWQLPKHGRQDFNEDFEADAPGLYIICTCLVCCFRFRSHNVAEVSPGIFGFNGPEAGDPAFGGFTIPPGQAPPPDCPTSSQHRCAPARADALELWPFSFAEHTWRVLPFTCTTRVSYSRAHLEASCFQLCKRHVLTPRGWGGTGRAVVACYSRVL